MEVRSGQRAINDVCLNPFAGKLGRGEVLGCWDTDVDGLLGRLAEISRAMSELQEKRRDRAIGMEQFKDEVNALEALRATMESRAPVYLS